jgi:HSP20 family protein
MYACIRFLALQLLINKHKVLRKNYKQDKIMNQQIAKTYSNLSNVPVFTNLMENFFGREFSELLGRDLGTAVPAVNIVEDTDHFRLDVAAPGLKKDDFKVSVHEQQLVISAVAQSSSEEKTEKFTRREFNYNSFQRSFTLPNTVNSEKIEARYVDGVLSVVVPKREEAKQKEARTIDVA